ncbi:hypothetical protein IFM89_032672 [Coptis chinensis]|uniref:F-box/LRR-repeat protein 15/At3g58940/PEG3-like LRR domain-containing protein n=1 Tax=Coptis chinensis TaxID=261450 RepID=A0A835M567_9MAGN|nr:hypothetical protein IFM89_032672 [Coptis chinensis]
MTMIQRIFFSKEVRDWLDLPEDVTILIFMKLETIELLQNAQMEVINRSSGQLVEFCYHGWVTDELLLYVAFRSTSLKYLRLEACIKLSKAGLIVAARKLPLLEELELCWYCYSGKVIEEVGRYCQKLKYFRLSNKFHLNDKNNCNDDAIAIAQSMPQLRRLNLFANSLTNDGLQAILDGCPHLEFLDLQQCSGIHLEGEFLKKCVDRFKVLRF